LNKEYTNAPTKMGLWEPKRNSKRREVTAMTIPPPFALCSHISGKPDFWTPKILRALTTIKRAWCGRNKKKGNRWGSIKKFIVKKATIQTYFMPPKIPASHRRRNPLYFYCHGSYKKGNKLKKQPCWYKRVGHDQSPRG